MGVNVQIIFENNDFVVVDKRPDCNFHDENELGQGLFNQVKNHGHYSQLYPVHRLDKMTSGLILFAKHIGAATEFGRLFEQHLIDKFYLAISSDKPQKKQGWIKGDMEKSRRSAWRLTRRLTNPAITQFFSYHCNNQRLFVLKPLTGKTHQLRVALKSIGSAILGDPIYHTEQGTDRGYLHAYALKFRFNNEDFEFLQMPSIGECFLNEHCQRVLTDMGKPWQLPWPNHKKDNSK